MKNFLLLLFGCLQTIAVAQLQPVFVSDVRVSADRFLGFDNLGANYYLKDNTFYKEKEGKILEYKSISLGRVEKADFINPMSIVLFYKDFNAVVFLDNQLNEIRRINFSEFSEPLTVTAAGNASQNRLWVYNSINQQIGLFDYLKNTVSYLAQPIKGNIVHYETDFNYFQWLDDSGNRYSCDVFGKILSFGKWPAEPFSQFVSNSAMLYAKGGNLYVYTLTDNSAQVVDLGKKSALGFWYNAQNLAIFTAEGISIHKLKLR